MQSTVIWVALGSAIGGAGRYWCAALMSRVAGDAFPWGTLFVNVTGSLVIGALAAASGPDGRGLMSDNARQFLMVGVLGGFTTFSAFSLQTLALAERGEWLRAAANVGGSVVLCLIAVWAGYAAVLSVSR